MSRYKIGDRFTKKNTRDSQVFEIESVEYRIGLEPEYELKGIMFGNVIRIREEALSEMYSKI